MRSQHCSKVTNFRSIEFEFEWTESEEEIVIFWWNNFESTTNSLLRKSQRFVYNQLSVFFFYFFSLSDERNVRMECADFFPLSFQRFFVKLLFHLPLHIFSLFTSPIFLWKIVLLRVEFLSVFRLSVRLSVYSFAHQNRVSQFNRWPWFINLKIWNNAIIRSSGKKSL